MTALDLIAYAAADENPDTFVHCNSQELEQRIAKIQDPALKHTLQFGIGLHHAGLSPKIAGVAEQLFAECKIQVLVSTSTLAWGVNLPAHLVVIKGTEFYDGKTKRYQDFPITDVLQMMGESWKARSLIKAAVASFSYTNRRRIFTKVLVRTVSSGVML